MGFESFRIELRGGRSAFQEADAAIRRLPHLELDRDSMPMPGSAFYRINDGRHVLELEVLDAPVHVSCRFTLCHPSSVDAAFLQLVRDLMIRLDMEARICDDVPPEHSHSFALGDWKEFAAITSRVIAARRSEWRAAFEGEPLAASTKEVYERIILPRCQPGVEHPA